VYLLGRKLFDPGVASVAACIVFGTELLWRFTYSGLSTNLVLILLLALVRVMVALDEATHGDPPAPTGRLLRLALTAGVLAGLLCLTRYGVGIVVVPVCGFLLLWGGARRWVLAPAALVAFLLVVAPWLARNYQVS